MDLQYSDSVALSFRTEAAAQKAPWTYGEEMNYLASLWELEGKAFSQTEVLPEAIVLLLSPLNMKPAGGYYIWISIILANTVHPDLLITWNPTLANLWAHPNYSQWLFLGIGLS